MAFSLRKIISNMNYFKKPDDEMKVNLAGSHNVTHDPAFAIDANLENYECDNLEPDSTSNQFSGSLSLPESVRNFAAKKGSLSDTDLLATKVDTPKQCKRKLRTLKLDINKAKQSNSDLSSSGENVNLENTPKHIHLQSNDSESDAFTERFNKLNSNKSFDLNIHLSDEHISMSDEETYKADSLAEDSESDAISLYGKEIKMCRKVNFSDSEIGLDITHDTVATPDSFVKLDDKEDFASKQNYVKRLEQIVGFLMKLFSDYELHLLELENKPVQDNITENENVNNQNSWMDISSPEISPKEPENVLGRHQEDRDMEVKIKQELLTMKAKIEQFVNKHYDKKPETQNKNLSSDKKPKTRKQYRRAMGNKIAKKFRIKKKKPGHGDFPDLSDAFHYLFEDQATMMMPDTNDLNISSCSCNCHFPQADSGLTSRSSDQTLSNQSITSSIGNFSLDSTTLSAFSESLDLIISYNSFDESSLYGTMLRKPAADRITFYIQVHSIEITSQTSENILFHCTSCNINECDENGVLKHILSQKHCEKIHFLYKTAYIKKCVASGIEIQPSTVLNPMKMYRDDNKIVCFGDAKYACSLCFENQIVGESILMGHCSDPEHVNRREMLQEILD